jgi:hypothetical protein
LCQRPHDKTLTLSRMETNMLETIVRQITPQVKTQHSTRQELLTQALTLAVANKSTKQEIKIDGQKFTFLFKSGTGDNRSHYVITTTKNEAITVDAVSKREASLLKAVGKPVPTKIQSFTKPIESGKVLEVELSISSRNGSSVVVVAGWSNEVDTYVAKVCGELGWPFKSARKVAFEQRVEMLRGDQSYID